MEQIYINLPETLEPGEVVVGEISATGGPARIIALKCIRAAALDEYLEFVTSHGLMHMVNRRIHDMKLYLMEVLD